MICDQARAILGVTSEAAKNYVTRGKDRVMNWPNGVAPRSMTVLPFAVAGTSERDCGDYGTDGKTE